MNKNEKVKLVELDKVNVNQVKVCNHCGEANVTSSSHCINCMESLEHTEVSDFTTAANGASVDKVTSESNKRSKEYCGRIKRRVNHKIITIVVVILTAIVAFVIYYYMTSPTAIAKNFFYAIKDNNFEKASTLAWPEYRNTIKNPRYCVSINPEFKIVKVSANVDGVHAQVKIEYAEYADIGGLRVKVIGGLSAIVILEKRNWRWMVAFPGLQ
jgi:hypothetical protein